MIAASLVVTGVVVQVQVMAIYASRGDMANAAIVPFFRLVTLAIFAACIAGAVALRERRPDWHSRLMMLGTFSVLEAAFGRFVANLLHHGSWVGRHLRGN